MTDVNKAGGGSHYDNQESFLFAEVMKYAYLVHAEGNISIPTDSQDIHANEIL